MKMLKTVILSGVAAMLLPSCNDVLGDLYDDGMVATSEYGFVETSTGSTPGLIYINATDYKAWTYIDFENRRIDSISVTEPEPAQWDFAIHRYDAKTNRAAVVETSFTDISLALLWSEADAGDEVADIWTTDKIVTDMSTMMDGYLSYVGSFYNTKLSEWLNVDTSTMPPVYTTSDKVYIILLRNGRRAAVKLSDYMNATGIKGYMSIQYIYPL